MKNVAFCGGYFICAYAWCCLSVVSFVIKLPQFKPGVLCFSRFRYAAFEFT